MSFIDLNPLTGQLDLVGSRNTDDAIVDGETIRAPSQNAVFDALVTKQASIGGVNNQLVWKNNSGAVESNTAFQVTPRSGLSRHNQIVHNDDNDFKLLNENYTQVNALRDSDNDVAIINTYILDLDPARVGFNIGVNQFRAVAAHQTNVYHLGASDSGGLVAFETSINIGNGTDAIDVKGMSYHNGFGLVKSGVTLSGGIQGYGFQPQIQSGVNVNQHTQAFYDNSNFSSPAKGYTSFNSSPNISEISNNNGFSNFNSFVNIPLFTGNAYYIGLGLFGSLGTFDTGSYQGVNISTVIASVSRATGLQVSPNISLVTSYYQGVNISGTVVGDGTSNASGIRIDMSQVTNMTQGQTLAIDASGAPCRYSFQVDALAAAGVQIGDNHQNIYKISDSQTLTGTMAFLDMQLSAVDIGDSATMDDGPFGVASIMNKVFNSSPTGTSTAGQVNTVHNVVALISVEGGSAGGTIDKYTQFMALEFPGGAMTINNLYGFKQTAPAGTVAINAWGVYIEPQYPNYFSGSVKIGNGADVATIGYFLEVEGSARIETSLGEIFKANNQGLSFFGNATVAQQPSSGPQTASATYTSTEQTMIQEMYNCLRIYGLLN